MKEDGHSFKSIAMEVVITAESTLKSIQHAFNELYPFLKIEFMKKWHKDESAKPEKLNSENQARLYSPDLKSCALSLDPQLTVSQLELNFLQLLHLNVKVFRRSGTVWVETLHTEHWTLEQQNEEGKLFSSPDVR